MRHFLIEKLIKLRKEYNFSQSYVAQNVGIDVFKYISIENGNTMFTFEEILKISDFYNINPIKLFLNDEEIEFNNLYKIKFKFIEILNKFGIYLYIVPFVVILFLFIIFTLPKKDRITVYKTYSQNDLIAANEYGVISIEDGIVKTLGNNINGQLDIDVDEKILKVEMGQTFSVLLLDNGKVKTFGLAHKYARKLNNIKNVVDIAVGNYHILMLLKNGEVLCVGDNSYNQCEVKKWKNINKIFADENGSIGIGSETFVSGNVIFKNDIKNIKNIKNIAFNDNVVFFVDENNDVNYFSNETFEINDWKEIDDIEIGNGFIVAKKNNGSVLIKTNNYLIKDEVKNWNAISIASGKDYLVANIEGEIIGIGNNKYNQFIKKEIVKELNSVSNINIVQDKENIKINYDYVDNADYYEISIDIDEGYSLKTPHNYVYIPISKMVNNYDYTIRISAKSNNVNYKESQTSVHKYLYTENPRTDSTKDNNDEVVLIEIPFKIENILGRNVLDFENYLSSLGIEKNKVTKIKNLQPCENEEIVISIKGINEGETITKSELLKRNIEYEYCTIQNQ